jgi:DDE superfamily endonuclease
VEAKIGDLEIHVKSIKKGQGCTLLLQLSKLPVTLDRNSSLDKEFGKKTAQARYFVVRRLLIHHGYSLHHYTNESQRCPLHVVTEAAGFIHFMRSIVTLPHVHPDFVINMDQTGVFFCMTRKTTIAKRGTKTVKVWTTDKNRCTLAVTVTASGRMLRPLVVLKGTENGRIESKELGTYTKDMVYRAQGNAWMDERVMMVWIDEVLRPYTKKAVGIKPLLILDAYSVHKRFSSLRHRKPGMSRRVHPRWLHELVSASQCWDQQITEVSTV